MHSLADQIEQYIKKMLERSDNNEIEIQRNQLAQLFQCVPSQITYVVTTRFTLEQGYLVESRRGGGGYLKIIRLPLTTEEEIIHLINDSIDKLVSQRAGEGLIARLEEEGFLTRREAMLMLGVIRRESIPVPLPERDFVRAQILRSMLLTILNDEFHKRGED